MVERAFIIGGGRFGVLAARHLRRPASKIWAEAVIEPAPSPELVELGGELGLEIRAEDGIGAVRALLAGPKPPEWIVPCLPRHLLAEWLVLGLAELEPVNLPVPEEALAGLDLPLAAPGPRQAWHLSLTDTICPPDCPEPAGRCLKSGQPRGRDLHERLSAMSLAGFGTAVLNSRQLAPGLGGLRSGDMLGLRGQLAARGGSWLVATACRCHGVLNALRLARREPRGKIT